MLHFPCPSCGAKLSGPETKVGCVAKCPRCGEKIVVPAPPKTLDAIAVELPPKTNSSQWTRVSVSGRRFEWRAQCACCWGDPDTSVELVHTRRLGVRVIHNQSRGWTIPYCKACLKHIECYARTTTIVEEMRKYGGSEQDLLDQAAAALAEAKRLLKPSCCPDMLAVIYDGWNGSIHTFRFHDDKFAEAFAESNHIKLKSRRKRSADGGLDVTIYV